MAHVLVIGDTHAPGMRSGYVDFLKRVADIYDINRIVHIGDLVDWASISFHEKSPALCNASREFENARRQVACLARAFPKVDWLIGNHDALTERQALAVGLPKQVLRDYSELWEIDWVVHPRFSKICIDGVLYFHGDSGRGCNDAALAHAKDHFRSTAIGHFHSQAGVKWWANPEFRVFGLSVGCGIDTSRLQFEYGRRIVAKPILGCGVVINGRRAFFEPWLLKSRLGASMRIEVVDKMARLRRREVESQRSGEFGGRIDPPSGEDDASLNVTGECHDCGDHLLSCRCSPGEG